MKLFYNARIFSKNKLFLGFLLTKNGIIDQVVEGMPPEEVLNSIPEEVDRMDCKNALLLPGFIDAHVHFRDANQAHKETLATGSKGAIAGGVTTVLSMPNTDPPLSTVESLQEYIREAESNPLFCNIGLYTTVKEGFNLEQLENIRDLGVFGIKIYPGDQSKSVPLEWAPGWINDADPDFFVESLPKMMQHFMNEYPTWEELFKRAKQTNLPVVLHPEYPRDAKTSKRMWETGVAIAQAEKPLHPNLFAHDIHHPLYTNELANVEMIAALLHKFFPDPKDAPHVHFVHVSHPDPINVVKKALVDAKYSASVEVSPHHALLHNSMEFTNENYAKVLVPLRKEKIQQDLFTLLKQGAVDSIGTDHAPHTREEKEQKFEDAPSGFPYIDFSSRILLTEVFADRLDLETVVKCYAINPAILFGIINKGEIKVGYDADFTLVQEVDPYPIKGSDMLSKQKWTPWEDHLLTAQIHAVFLKGNLSYSKNNGVTSPMGKIIRKQTS